LKRRLVVAATAAAALLGCGSQRSPEHKLADQVTQSVYADDVQGVVQNFDADLQRQVKRADVGLISDKMHALGVYQGLTPTTADPQARRYAYQANFSNGTMQVEMRLDADGKIAAYRVLPAAPIKPVR
jgi:hypothetical protein